MNSPNYSSFKSKFKISYGLKSATKRLKKKNKTATDLAVRFAKHYEEMPTCHSSFLCSCTPDVFQKQDTVSQRGGTCP